MTRLLAIALLGAAPALAQQPAQPQPPRQPTLLELHGVLEAVKGQRDFAQGQAANASATANAIAAEHAAMKEQLAEALKKCGEACKPEPAK